jgi:trimethylamine:corrinoid methyltransferase-like protein
LLSNEQIEAIHHTILDILSRTGVIMQSEGACEPLLKVGARE